MIMGQTKPDRGYAYVILLVSFLGLFLVHGVVYAMGIFYNEFGNVFEDSNASIALISSLHSAMFLFIGKLI